MSKIPYDTIAEITGAVITCIGLWLIYMPVAFIIAGLYIIYISQGLRR